MGDKEGWVEKLCLRVGGWGGSCSHIQTLLLGSVWVWREMQVAVQALFWWGHTTKHALLSSKKADSG